MSNIEVSQIIDPIPATDGAGAITSCGATTDSKD